MPKSAPFRSEVTFSLNGDTLTIPASEASEMLADFIRKRRQLTGTKIVCAEGDCGACTVLKASPYSSQRGSAGEYLPVNSCILPVASLDGAKIVTVEGLTPKVSGESATKSDLHPAQDAMIRCHGSQCGFCTPGFVMALAGLAEKRIRAGKTKSPIQEKEAKNALTANLCRCTGYAPIVNAACSMKLQKCKSVKTLHETPAQNKTLKECLKTDLLLNTDGFTYFAPTTLKSAAQYLAKNPNAKLISGSTDLGVLHNKRKLPMSHLVSLHLIPEVYALKKLARGRIQVGARVTLSELRRALKGKVAPEMASFLDLFASPQIKNQATLVGNLANASPIGDTPPFLLVSNTEVHVAKAATGGKLKTRKIPIESFFLGYRKTALDKGEFITAVEFDLPTARDTLRLKKISQRKDLDISTVNAAFRIQWDSKRTRAKAVKIAFGGVAATPVRLPKLEALFVGKNPKEVSMNEALSELHLGITPLNDLRSTSAFRRVTAENLFKDFIREICS